MMNLSEISRYISQVNIKTTPAKLLLNPEPAKLEITRDRGGLDIETEPIKLDLDNRAFFDSLGLKSISAFADDNVAKSQKAVLEVMARYAREAEIKATPKCNNAISQIGIMRTQKSIEMMLVFIPEEGPEINWTGGTIDIEYTLDKLNFNWCIQDLKGTYIPYSVEYSVE